jgi:DNA-binding CsgD family transcriptional regulator
VARRNKFTNLGTISLWLFSSFSNIFNVESVPAGIPIEAGMVEEKEEKNSRFHLSPVYAQIALVVLAFALLVCISLWFMSGIMNRHMTDSITAAFDNTETNITADLKEMETQLDYISETVRLMILKGFNFNTVADYITEISGYMMSADERFKEYATGVYGVFDVFDGKYHDGTGWNPPPSFVPESRPWYKAAVLADGNVAITEPYISVATAEYTITFSRRIDDEKGIPLGIVCLDILLDRVRCYAVNTHFTQGGYGLLLNSQIEMLAHPDQTMWGKALKDIDSGYIALADDLEQGVPVFERRMNNYKQEASVVSFRQFKNGWHIGMVIHEKEYFNEMRRMRLILIALGLALSALFSAVLLRLSAVSKELQDIKEDHGLTAREQEIFSLLLSGKEPKEIALTLKISYSGVSFHVKNLFSKLGVQSRTDLLVKYRMPNQKNLQNTPKKAYL